MKTIADLTRRRALQMTTAGIAGLSLPGLLRAEATRSRKSVILLWMAGGPSQIDTWDPKPQRPVENRGPFSTISTNVPGIQVSEHLPKQAAMMDRFSLIRSVDAAGSNHSPGRVMQTGTRKGAPRTNANGAMYPAIGSVVAKFRGPNEPGMPPYVAFNRDPNHVPGGGFLGMRYNPMNGHRAAGLPDYQGFGRLSESDAAAAKTVRFELPPGVDAGRLHARQNLIQQLSGLRSDLDKSGAMDALDHFQQEAIDMVLGGKAQAAFDIDREPQTARDRYGKHLWCQQALIARRLVESGVNFVTIDLTMGVNAGDWDSHGVEHVFGGIETGLKPLLPIFDHLITTLVSDLEERGMLDDVLILAMGEFGRSPVVGNQKGFTGGRNHWPRVMSMCLAGGGLSHGQVIGSSDPAGGEPRERPIAPADLAATIYQHMGVPLNGTYLDTGGRPIHIVEGAGAPIRELYVS